MTRSTRRSVLATGSGLLAALAGCTGRTDRGESRPADTTSTTKLTTTTNRPTTLENEHLAWTRDFVPSTAPLATDGRVLVGDESGVVHALEADGEDAWTYDAGTRIHRLRPQGDVLYLTTGRPSGPHIADTVVHAVELDGTKRWSVAVGESYRTPVLLGESSGVLGVGLHNDMLEGTGEATFGLDAADGTEQWRVGTGDVGGGAVGSQTIYAAEYDEVSALDPADGEKRWSRPERFAHAPTMVDDVPVFGGDELTAVDPQTGDERWTYGEDLDLAGAVGIGDRAYSRGGVVAALSADGTEEWRYDEGGGVDVGSDGLLFGHDEANCFALSAEGAERWRIDRPTEYFDYAATTGRFVAGAAEDAVMVFDRETGTEAYRFSVDARHVGAMAGTANRLFVAGKSRLYGLEG